MRSHLCAGVLLLLVSLVLACSDTSAPPDDESGSEEPPQASSSPTAPPSPTRTPSPPPPSPTPSPTPTPTAEPQGPTAMDVITLAAAAMRKTNSLQFDMEIKATVKSSSGTLELPISLRGDFHAPDSSHGTMLLSFGAFAVESDVVNVAGTTYIKDVATGLWDAQVPSSPVFSGPGLFVVPDPDTLGSLELLGEEVVEGVDSYRVRGVAPAGSLEETVGEMRMQFWVAKDNGRLLQIMVEGTVDLRPDSGSLSRQSTTGTADIEATIKLSEFGKSVSINVPDRLAPTVVAGEMPTPGLPPRPFAPPTAQPTTPTSKAPPLPIVPTVRLEVGGQSQNGVHLSFSGEGVYVDSTGKPYPSDELKAPGGARLEFVLGVDDAPEEITIYVYPPGSDAGRFGRFPDSFLLKGVLPLAPADVSIPEAGTYEIVLAVSWANLRANYGFLVALQPRFQLVVSLGGAE